MENIYCAEIYSLQNVEATRIRVKQLLDDARKRKKIPDEKTFLGMNKDSQNIPCFRDNAKKDLYGEYEGIARFSIKLHEICKDPHAYSEKMIVLLKQNDGFSCSGASIFTCTAGFVKISLNKILEIKRFIEENNVWETKHDQIMPDLPVEGMAKLLYDTAGILPVVMFGRIARKEGPGKWEKLDEEDNLFNDEERFVKLMRLMRYASIALHSNNHWVSLVCIPAEDRTIFVICDSLSHDVMTVYPSFKSLRDYFFAEQIKPTDRNPIAHVFPLTLSIYPVVDAREDADHTTQEFMRRLIATLVYSMENDDKPFVSWRNVSDLLDEM